MAKKKSLSKKSKRTKSKKKKSKSKEKEPELPCRLLWLYGPNERVIIRSIQRIMKYGDPDSIRLRDAMGVSMDTGLIFVYPHPGTSRLGLIEKASQLENVSIITAGLPQDKDRKKVHQYYKGAELFWIHPGERQFHIDMAGVNQEMTYQQANQKQKEFLSFFEDHFKSKDISVIR